MSRGYRNDGYEMDDYPSRTHEESLPGQVDERYYHDYPNRRIQDRDYDDSNSYERHNRPPPQRRYDPYYRHSRHERGDVDELEHRFQRYDSSSERAESPRQDLRQRGRQSGNHDKPDRSYAPTRNDGQWIPRQTHGPSYDDYQRPNEPNEDIYSISGHFSPEPDARSAYLSHTSSYRGPEAADSQRNDSRGRPNYQDSIEEGRQAPTSSRWNDVMNKLPSQVDRDRGTVRYRASLGNVLAMLPQQRFPTDEADMQIEEDQSRTKTEVFEQLYKLREQPWSFQLRRQRKWELKKRLEDFGGKKYAMQPVVSVVESGSSKVHDVVNTLDPLHGVLKRIEGKHGASVVAVFNFIRDMIRLNFVLALLLLGGVVVPSSISVSEDTDQLYGWFSGGNCTSQPKDVCRILELQNDSWLSECHQNYVDKIDSVVSNHSSKPLALIQDVLQGTGFLEYTLLFSGYYPTAVENGSYLVSLAYLLTVFVTYIVSLIFVVHAVAKFLKNITSTTSNYSLIFSKIVFTGWDFTVKEPDAAKIETALFICEVKAAFDEEEHNRRSLQRTRNDKIKLYLVRFLINLIITALIGGSWAGIYFLIKEAQMHGGDTAFLQFIWEYAPTLVVAALNIIFPMIFTFLVTFEQYKGSFELFLTLSRCVLVRLISLAILIISKVGLISQQSSECEADNEFVCWETYLGQQVYSVLILDALIQIGMSLFVNVARSLLRRIDNPVCKMIGTIEFFVPGHVLDVVYVQTVCWIGVLYSPLIVPACLLYFCVLFLLKLFTISVTCVPATRVFRASRSSAMFMTIMALAFLMCLVPNGLALYYLCPSIACSPFRGLGYAWQSVTFYICGLRDKTYWIRSVLFIIDDTMVLITIFFIVFLVAIYYIALISARGALIEDLEKKLKNASKDKSYLLQQYKNVQAMSIDG